MVQQREISNGMEMMDQYQTIDSDLLSYIIRQQFFSNSTKNDFRMINTQIV